MSETQARKQLRRMLESRLTIGSVLHLLAEAFRAHSEQNQTDADPLIAQQCDLADAVLIVVGMGLDAAIPR